MRAKALNKSRTSSKGLVALAESEGSGTRYHVLIRVTKSVIETAKYAVDNENMNTITPNKIFWLEECRPLFL